MKTKKRIAKKLFVISLFMLGLLVIMAAFGFVGYSAQAAMDEETEIIEPYPVPQASPDALATGTFGHDPMHKALLFTAITFICVVGVLVLSATLAVVLKVRALPKPVPPKTKAQPLGKRELLLEEMDWETVYRQ